MSPFVIPLNIKHFCMEGLFIMIFYLIWTSISRSSLNFKVMLTCLQFPLLTKHDTSFIYYIMSGIKVHLSSLIIFAITKVIVDPSIILFGILLTHIFEHQYYAPEISLSCR